MTTWSLDGPRGVDHLGNGVLDRVRERVALEPLNYRTIVQALRAEGVIVSDDALVDLAADVLREFEGLGRIEPLLRMAGVTDILVNGTHGTWIDCGSGLQQVAQARFTEEVQVRSLAQRLADGVGRRLDEASPWVDAQLPQGLRLHAVIPPLAVDGTVISLRIPARRGFDLAALQAAGSVDGHGATWLGAVVAARLTFLISGGTGSGKTTVLGALLGAVPRAERMVIVEDSTELDPAHPHCVRLQARTANIEGAGAMSLRDLLRQALRMRPDRIVVGEVRGPEVLDLLTAFNTGHEGCCGTVHANRARDVPARLEALGLTAGIPRAAVHALIGAGLDAIVHLQHASGPDGVRRRTVEGIHVVEPVPWSAGDDGRTDGVRVSNAVTFDVVTGDVSRGPGFALLAERLRERGVIAPVTEIAA